MRRIYALVLAVIFILLQACGTDSDAVSHSKPSDTVSVGGQISSTDSTSGEIGSTVSSADSDIGTPDASSAASEAIPSQGEVVVTPSAPTSSVVIPTPPTPPPAPPVTSSQVTSSSKPDTKPPVYNQSHTALSPDKYYQYSQMSAGEKQVYDRLKVSALNYQNYTDISDLEIKLKPKEATKIMNAFRADYPQYFWVSNYVSVSYREDTGFVTKCVLLYTDGENTDNLSTGKRADREKIKSKRTAVDSVIKDIVSKIGTSWSVYEKEKYIHDYLAENMKYDTPAAQDPYINGGLKPAFSILGAFIDKKGVCEAYSKAFQTLCYEVGINANQVIGEGHMWNTVNLGGDWYQVDVTWDDPIYNDANGNPTDRQGTVYAYFNLTSAKMYETHTVASESDIKVPNCTATKYAYKK